MVSSKWLWWKNLINKFWKYPLCFPEPANSLHSPNLPPDQRPSGKAIFINKHVWTIKHSCWWKSEMGPGLFHLLWRQASKFQENMSLQHKLSTRKDLAQPPLRGTHASSGQCCGGERLTGTPETISNSIKRRLGSRDDWESSVVSQERTQSVPWPYLASAGYHIKMSAGEGKKWRHKAQIMIQRNKKECQQQIPKSNEKIFVVWGWQDVCPAQHTLFREQPRVEE